MIFSRLCPVQWVSAIFFFFLLLPLHYGLLCVHSDSRVVIHRNNFNNQNTTYNFKKRNNKYKSSNCRKWLLNPWSQWSIYNIFFSSVTFLHDAGCVIVWLWVHCMEILCLKNVVWISSLVGCTNGCFKKKYLLHQLANLKEFSLLPESHRDTKLSWPPRAMC